MEEQQYQNKAKLSIGIIAFNEEEFLPNLLNDIKLQEYPHACIEVVLVDSKSLDKTKEIMLRFQQDNKDFYNIQVLDNPKRIQSAGWNVVIKNFTGDVLSRIDAHAKLPSEFSKLVMQDIESGENIVGGKRSCLIVNDTAWGQTLLATENSIFGSSINSSRRSEKKRYVNTMFHASYRRQVFDTVGLFNESLKRTEDNEIHYRMREAGYKFSYNPRIVSYQYARSELKKMVKQKLGNGYWIGLTAKICPGCISWYHLIPAIFVCGIVVTTFLVFNHHTFLAKLMWFVYGMFAIFNMGISFFQEKFNFYKLLMPIIFLILHVSYGIGTLIGVFKIKKG